MTVNPVFPDRANNRYGVALVALDRQGAIRYWDPAAERLLGWTSDEILGRPMPGLSDKDYREAIQECAKGSKRVLRRKDGRAVEVRLSSTHLGGESGAAQVLLLLPDPDITQTPSDSDCLRALMTTSPDHIYFKDSRSRFVRVNRALAQWFGVDDPDQITGKTDFDFFTSEHAEQAFEDELRIMQTGSALIAKVEKETWPQGISTWVSTTKAPLRDESGRIVGTLGISRDVTQYKLAEQAVRESEERFKALVQNSSEIVTILDPDGTVRYQSESLVGVLGYRPEEVQGTLAWELAHPADRPRIEAGLQELVKSPQGFKQSQLRFRNRDGQWRNLEILAHNLLDVPAVKGIVINSRDVTEFLRVEEELRRLTARMDQIVEDERRRIAHELHDELGQSLTGLLLELSHLRSEGLSGGRDALDAQLAHVSKMVADSLDTTRRISHELRPALLDQLGLEAALERQVEEFRGRSGMECLFRSTLGQADIDQQRSIAIYRIVQEALTNVARHSGATQVSVKLDKTSNMLTLEVRDDGRGFDKKSIIGSGSLGIVGMRERTVRLGGNLSIISQPGQGVTISAKIPMSGGGA